jgi:hypothetical protein
MIESKEVEMSRACNTNGGRGGMNIRYWWGSQKKSDHCGDQKVDGWITLKWVLE